jgi:hypothetical protein
VEGKKKKRKKRNLPPPPFREGEIWKIQRVDVGMNSTIDTNFGLAVDKDGAVYILLYIMQSLTLDSNHISLDFSSQLGEQELSGDLIREQ